MNISMIQRQLKVNSNLICELEGDSNCHKYVIRASKTDIIKAKYYGGFSAPDTTHLISDIRHRCEQIKRIRKQIKKLAELQRELKALKYRMLNERWI